MPNQPDIEVQYVETEFDRIGQGPEDQPNAVMVWGLPFRAEYDGIKVAATSPEGARQMIVGILDRRNTTTEEA